MTSPEVRYTAEVQRIANLPRRAWGSSDLATLARELTAIFRTPGGEQSLRQVQALALHDAGVEGGLFGPIGVGEGKTLISFLLPVVFEAKRPLLLVPGGLIEKTQRDRLELSRHWRIPTSLRVFSYDMLGRVEAEHELETYAPDALILEEGHRAKNKHAAVTRRIARYMYANPLTKVAILSGTVIDKSLKDCAHLALWALKLGAPVPTTVEEIIEWAEALDEPRDAWGERRRPGALMSFATDAERAAGPPWVAARHGFRRRLTETPGVVATVGEGEHVDCSIYVRAIRHKVSDVTERNFRTLRGDSKQRDEFPGWLTPDGWELKQASDVWRHAQELALGLHYVWDPRPPEEWLSARREWGAFVRATITGGRTYDSEKHVRDAVDAGELGVTGAGDGPAALAKWRALEPTFTPNVVPVWHDDSALKECAAWMKKPGIVWTEHRFFAHRLAEITGAPYFGEGGFAADGSYIEAAAPGSVCIASIDANREGKNLQGIWSRNLIVCPPTSAAWMEQLIARTHRPGQKADEVTVDILLGCRENFDALQKALAGAKAIREMTGKQQKLLLADLSLPSEAEIEALRSPRWMK